MSFPQDEILVALMRGPKKGMSIKELVEVTGRATSTVRQNLRVLEYGYYRGESWVERVPGSRSVSKHLPARYRLTSKGREIARFRARSMK